MTARDFAQTLELLERFAIPHVAVGHHRGERRSAKALGLPRARGRPPLGASSAAAGWLAIEALRPRARPWLQRRKCRRRAASGSRARRRSTTSTRSCSTSQLPPRERRRRPRRDPAERLRRYGAGKKLAPYPGLKEEYYLADFEPNVAVLEELLLERTKPIIVVRTPPELALYHRFASDLFGELLASLARCLTGARRAGRGPRAHPRAALAAARARRAEAPSARDRRSIA